MKQIPSLPPSGGVSISAEGSDLLEDEPLSEGAPPSGGWKMIGASWPDSRHGVASPRFRIALHNLAPARQLAQDAWGHDPTKLLALGDLVRFLDQAGSAVQTNWATVKDWKVDSRYQHAVDPATVRAFLDALDDPQDGVLLWLRKHC